MRKANKNNNVKVKYPIIAAQWHRTKNGDLLPENFLPYSNKKVWWKCDKGDDHEWQAVIYNRTLANHKCPYCAGKKASKNYNLKIKYPIIAAQWHRTKNGDLLPENYTHGSDKKAWWMCDRGHEWPATISSRVAGHHCPFCSNQNSSQEIRILSELESIFNNTKHRHKINGKEIDIYLPNYQIGVEYDGYYYHKSKQLNDKNKGEYFKSTGINIIRIRRSPLTKINSLDIIHKKNELTKSDINKLIIEIIKISAIKSKYKINDYLTKKDFSNNKKYNTYLSLLPGPLPHKSLLVISPSSGAQWHPTKNGDLLPEKFLPYSNKKVWWKCDKGDDHEWQTTIAKRTFGRKCPYCTNQKASKNNNLKVKYPIIAAQLHPTKNADLLPENFLPYSNKKLWWKCDKGDDHEWQARICDRTRGRGRCIYCANLIAHKKYNLFIVEPLIAAQWHPTKNTDLLPENFLPKSHKKIWWKCDKGDDHEWQARICDRTRGRGCRDCSGRKKL